MPVRTQFRSTNLSYNGRFTQQLDEGIKKLMRAAAREWLREIILHVRVWSGESLGSIKFADGPNGNLGRFLNVSIPMIDPIRGNSPYEIKGKGPTTGHGEYNFSSARHVYTFFFRSDVVQYTVNEFFKNVSSTSPWQSLNQAQIAFESFIANNIDRYKPKLETIFIRRVD